MNFKSILLCAAAAAMLAVLGTAQASTWSLISSTSSPITLGVNKVYYSPSPANEIWYYNGNLTPQNYSSIQSNVETQFGLASGSLTYVSGCDLPTSICTGGSGGTTSGSHYTNTFTSNYAYDYLAVHWGGGEFLFHWSIPVAAGTVFEIGGLPKGLSDYRAFSSGVSPVPLPAAAWLFGSALLGFTVVANRRRV